MTSSLESLAFRAGLDADQYARGSKALVAANDAMASSSAAVGAALRESQNKISVAGNGFSSMERRFSSGAKAGLTFAQSLVNVSKALEKDNSLFDRSVNILVGLQSSLGKTANGAEFASAGFTQLGAAIDAANARMRDSAMEQLAARAEHLRLTLDEDYAAARRLDAALADLAEAERLGVQITGGYADALDKLILKHDAVAQAAKRAADEQSAMIARARADQAAMNAGQIASANQQHFSAPAGVRDIPTGSARDSASAFEASARAVAQLRAEIDPMGAATARLNAELAEYAHLAHVGAISTAEMEKAQALARTRFAQTTQVVRAVGAAHEAASFQTANLAAQFQDIAVTASMGMSPLQIALQQGTQISPVFGNAGAAGAVKMLGSAFLSVISPTSLLTIGLVAGAAAAIQFFGKLASGSDSATATMAKLSESLGGVRGMMKELEGVQNDYRDAVRASAETHSSASASMIADTRAEFDAKKSLLQLQLTYQQALLNTKQEELDQKQQALQKEIQKAVTTRLDLESRGYGDAKSGRFVALPDDITGLEKTRDLLEKSPLSLELKKLRAEQSLNEISAKELEKALATTFTTIIGGTSSVTQLGNAMAESARQTMGFGQALNAMTAMVPKLSAAKGAIDGVTEANRAHTAAISALDADMRNGVIKSEETYFEKLKKANELHRQAVDAVTGYADVLEDLKRAEQGNAADAMPDRAGAAQRIRDSYAAQEKAIRERLSSSRSEAEVNELVRRNTEAMNAAIANSNKGFDDQIKARARSYDEAVRQQQTELALVGKTTAEVAALQFQEQSLAALREEAARNNTQMNAAEVATIKEKAAEIGKLAGQIAAANALDDLSFNREQFSRSKDEQQVYSQIRSLGLDINSSDGKRVADSIRLNQQLEKQRDFADDIASSFAGLFDGPIKDADDFFNKLTSGFAKIGQANLEKSFSMLSGGAQAAPATPGRGASSGISQVGSFFSNLFGGSAFSSSQTKQIQTQAAKVSVAPVNSILGTLSDGIRKTATDLGVAARDVATAISFETGGTFNTWQKGPTTKWGEHRGLIQWGEPQRQQYGVTQAMSAAEQMGAVTKYLRDAGVKAGMGLKDIYSAINAGHVGLYDRSDAKYGGTGTVADKVNNQMAGHYVNADRLLGDSPNLSSAVAKGTATGVVAGNVATMQAASAGASPSVAPAASAGGGFGGALSAGLGGFGLGAQSGSPVMGALGGAISGFSSFGVPGAIIGGIAGLFGGIFGGNQKKKQERNAAKATLNENRGAIADFLTVANGSQPGSAMSEWNQIRDQGIQFEQQANKAGEKKTTGKSLIDAINGAFVRIWKEQAAGFDGTVAAYSSGLGEDSGFLQGKSAVKDLSGTLMSLVQDIGDMRHKAIELKAIPLDAVDNYNRETDAKIAEMEGAGKKMALATITGAQSFSTMETQMQKFDGAAVALQGTLEKLGDTSDEAAAAIKGALDLGVAKLRDSYSADANASINDKLGLGFINDLKSAQQTYQESLRDATAIGLDGSIALRDLSLSVKQIGSDANLSKDEIAVLSDAFPTLRFMLAGLTDDTKSYADAQSDLQSAYSDSSSKLEDTISGLKSFSKSLDDFLAKMKIDDSSPLSGIDKVNEAGKQFRDTAAKAANGDTDAMGNLTSISQDYLDNAKAYYASSADYQAIWQEVQDTLSGTKKTADQTLTDTQQQLDLMKAQVGKLIDIDDSVLSVSAAINAFNVAQTRSLDDLKTQIAAQAKIGAESIEAAYKTYLDRAPTASEQGSWQNQLSAGSTVDQVTSAIGGSFEAQINSLSKQFLGHGASSGDQDYWKSTGITNPAYIGQAMNDSFEGRLNALYKDILNQPLDNASLRYWQGTGKSMDQIKADLEWTKSQRGYAAGGYTGGGGRSDVAGVVHGQEFVLNANATSQYRPEAEAMNRGTYRASNDNSSALMKMVDGLRSDNAALREEVERLADAMIFAQSRLIELGERNKAATQRTVSKVRVENAR